MTIDEIRESGLLELYVLGTLLGNDLTTVEQALVQYPELKADLNNIERTLQTYAFANAVPPSQGLKESILNEARKSIPGSDATGNGRKAAETATSSRRVFLYTLAAAMSLATAVFAYMWYNANQENKQLKQNLIVQAETCDSIRQQRDGQYALYQDLTNPNNNIVDVTPTAKYADTEIYFYHNPIDKKNYIQLKSLPPIDNNIQSYQLWSIKGTNPPAPLDVFQSDGDLVLKVQHVDATEVYAITIEPKGGRQTPTLADLIGTFAM